MTPTRLHPQKHCACGSELVWRRPPLNGVRGAGAARLGASLNPLAKSNSHSISSSYRKHENIKRRAYGQRIREIEHGCFTPLVLSLTGGMGPAASVCYKRLASMLAQKRDQEYSSTMAWLRCSLNFALLRSSIQCIRGARSAAGRAARDRELPPVDLVFSEAGHLA